jgi:ectoine hydroxylase-related dioxygenase (phytanoyl-CoA dioxygenase family)
MSERIVLRDMAEFQRTDLARTHRSTAGTQPPAAPALVAECMTQIEAEGYVIVPEVLSRDAVREVREAILPLLPDRLGRNTFEGFATQRVYAVLEKTRASDALVEHPLVLALLDRMLEPNYLLSQLQVINILPGEAEQPLHYDDGLYPWPRPRPALGAATIWAIDPFTADNGSTALIPRSHVWGDRAPTSEDLAQKKSAIMPPGSLLFFTGKLWHCGGANRSPAARLCVTAQYCAPWCRQQENFSLSVSRERARTSSDHIQRMLGYSIHSPFMGFVNGMHPKRLLVP